MPCNDSDMHVGLRFQDADAILALAEWALNHPDLEMGPGLHKWNAEEACRRIEAVADLARRGGSMTSNDSNAPRRSDGRVMHDETLGGIPGSGSPRHGDGIYPTVRGRCVSCHGNTLFLGEGGYVTCSLTSCPDPTATDRLLEQAHMYLPARCCFAGNGAVLMADGLSVDREDERGGSPVERPAGESSYGACGAPSCTMAWTATVRVLEVETERYRKALVRIADANSGHWGWIAHEALHPERAQTSEKDRPS